MAWKENLFQNLLTLSILSTLAIVVYCKIAKKTLGDFIRDIREGMASPIEE